MTTTPAFISRTFDAISGENGTDVDSTVTLTACAVEGIGLEIKSPWGVASVTLDLQTLLRISDAGKAIFNEMTKEN